MRKDAAARRDRLIEAAADLFERDGYDIALEVVAAAAGVGRATLYRNFPDRGALMTAVLTYKLAAMERFVATHDDDTTLVPSFLRRQGLVATVHAPAVAHLLTDPAQRHALQSLSDRTSKLVQQIVTRAHAVGRLRPDANVEHLRLATRMLMATRAWPHDPDVGSLDMAVDIIVRGLLPSKGPTG